MTYEQMLHCAATLPPDAIIIYSPFFSDISGRPFVPAEVVVKISKTASAPVFATLEDYLGHGIVGGSLLKTEAIGQLARGVAHDFNNMFGVILGYTELVMEQASAWPQCMEQ